MTAQATETDPFADSFDFESLRKVKWKDVRIFQIYSDYMVFESKARKRPTVFILFKRDGQFHLHGQGAGYGPLSFEKCSQRNHILTGDLQRVIKAICFAPTKPRAKRRRSPGLPLFPPLEIPPR